MLFLVLATLLGLGNSACNIAQVDGQYTGWAETTAVTAAWGGEVSFQIPAGACISLYVLNYPEYSGKWTCVIDSQNGNYMRYDVYENSNCAGSPITFDTFADFFNIVNQIAVAYYGGGYVFSSTTQAQNVLGLLSFGVTAYYTGTVSCGQSTNCGASVTQTIYSDQNECSGTVLARQSMGNLVSGLCAASVSIALNLQLDCTVLQNAGVANIDLINTLDGVCDDTINLSAGFSMGYVCKQDALWILKYDEPDCAGNYTGVRINEVCFNSQLGSYELDISCSNPNSAGSLNLMYKEGDMVEFSTSNACKFGVLIALFISFIVYLFQ